MMACFVKHLGMVELLIRSGADINSATTGNLTALMIACEDGEVAICKTLIKNRAWVNTVRAIDNMTALDIAIKYGHVDVICELRTCGAKTKF